MFVTGSSISRLSIGTASMVSLDTWEQHTNAVVRLDGSKRVVANFGGRVRD